MVNPYPEYKVSGIEWVGEIPITWQISKLKFITNKIIDGTHKTPEYVDKGIPFLRVTDLQNKEIDLNKCKYISTINHDLLTRRNKPDKGDLLLSKNGTIGITKIVDWDFPFSFFVSICLIRFKLGIIKPEYLGYMFQSNLVSVQIFESTKTTSVTNLHLDEINELSTIIPPISEQISIINYLDPRTRDMDDLIANEEMVIGFLKERRTAIINHAVIQGIDSHIKMKDSGIPWLGKIPIHWEIKKIRHFAEVNPTIKNADLHENDEGLVTFLPMENVFVDGTSNKDLKRKIKEIFTGFTYIERDDVIIAKITPCFENGKGALLNNLDCGFAFGSTEFHVLRAIDNFCRPKFLYYITRTDVFLKYGEAYMIGAAGQKRVPAEFIKNFTIGLPTLSEQDNIIAFIEKKLYNIDQSINWRLELIDFLKESRKTLISDAAIGKIDVRHARINVGA